MKFSKIFVQSKVFKILRPQFEEQELSSFSGLVVFQALFDRLNIKQRFVACFRHLNSSIFGNATIMLMLVIHILLGYRSLRDIQYYRDDPIVKRVLGLNRLPTVATLSRSLSCADT